ncbi:hypothetical protein [Sphingomonas jatrophae]|uniref:Right handed beta helix region n=1 Tax=Sphingomonas jatrophae TaxID=1166337 RepID=A0A1I6JRT7_9SPHN|nr:hypothetical protein [Sphingomonas jatrophae]SFR81689.1 hypothetical protein SAMN05192580_0744 [Sphingomonas jatrophae]
MVELPRRAVLGAAAMTSLGAVGSSAPGTATSQPVPQAGTLSLPTLEQLRRLTLPPVGALIYLSEAGREGWFRAASGPPPVSDPLEGLFVPTSGGHYVRLWDGVHGRPEWFGAIPNNGAVDCAPAIEACYALCPVTQLSQADYFNKRTLRLAQSWRTVQGVQGEAAEQGQGTRIVLSQQAPGVQRDDIVLIGTFEQPSHDHSRYPREIHIRNVTLIRDGDPAPHPSGDLRRSPAGLRIAHVERVTARDVISRESCLGFYIGGIVYSKLDDCLSIRTRSSATRANDIYAGFFLDGRISFGFAGGNASLYMNRCLAVGQGSGGKGSAGLIAQGAFVDSFIDQFESAGIASGMIFDAAGFRNPGQTVDLHIRNAILDGCSGTGISIDLDMTSGASIEILDLYIYAAGAGGDRGVAIFDGAGLVTMTGGQIHGDFRNGSVWLSRTRGVRLQGTKLHQASKPVVVTEASGLVLEPQINNVGKTSPEFAITCGALVRSIVRPVVIGAGGPSFRGGISLGPGSRHCHVDPTAVDPDSFGPPNPANKVWFNGTDARRSPTFASAGNVLSGVTD